jgi:hypothetical protein
MLLVNPSGQKGHWMPMDLNMEHLIGDLKGIFAAKGIYSNWDRAGDISASLNYLRIIKQQVNISLKLQYQGSSHTASSSAKELVWRMANRTRDEKLQETILDRQETYEVVPDLCVHGRQKFISSSLKTFNQKLKQYIDGKAIGEDATMYDEIDELPRVVLDLGSESDGDEGEDDVIL